MKINYGSILSPPPPKSIEDDPTKEKYQKKRSVVFFPKEGIAHSGPCRDQTRNLGAVSIALTSHPSLPAPPKRSSF